MSDYLNQMNGGQDGEFVFGSESGQKVFDLAKAVTAGQTTGASLYGQETSGSSLKVESLDPALKVLTNTDKHIALWGMIPKDKAYNTVEEVNQLVEYGQLGVGIFNSEGETPNFTDSIYKRIPFYVKYAGICGEVSHQATLVKTAGVNNLLTQEVKNKMQYLLRGLNTNIITADSSIIGNQFDGFYRQHYVGISGDTAALGAGLDTYCDSPFLIDARGSVLTESMTQDAANAIVTEGYGLAPSHIISAAGTFTNFAKSFLPNKTIMMGAPMSAISNGEVGQVVNFIHNQFGGVKAQTDIFFDQKISRKYNASATSAKAPSKPTKDGSNPTTVVTADVKSKWSGFTGDYWYAVASVNQYGYSAMELLSTTATTVTNATDAVDLLFTQVDSGYASEGIVIYRTKKGATSYTTADFFPIFQIAKSALAGQYDGSAGAGKVRDRNRKIPGTNSAIMLDNGIETWAIKELAPMMKMDLAITSPAYRFMILSYLTSALYAPKKLVKIDNIGDTFPA